MGDDVGNIEIQEDERRVRNQVDHLSRAEESMFKQRSRDLSINLGDGNTMYFYNLMRTRQTHSFISHIEDTEGNVLAVVFVSHFMKILAPDTEVHYPDLSHIIPHGYVTEDDAIALTR